MKPILTKNITFSKALKRLRKEQGLTQEAISELISKDPTTYQRYEAGKMEPNLFVLAKLAEIFGVSVDELLGIEKPAPKLDPYAVLEEVREMVKIANKSTIPPEIIQKLEKLKNYDKLTYIIDGFLLAEKAEKEDGSKKNLG